MSTITRFLVGFITAFVWISLVMATGCFLGFLVLKFGAWPVLMATWLVGWSSWVGYKYAATARRTSSPEGDKVVRKTKEEIQEELAKAREARHRLNNWLTPEKRERLDELFKDVPTTPISLTPEQVREVADRLAERYPKPILHVGEPLGQWCIEAKPGDSSALGWKNVNCPYCLKMIAETKKTVQGMREEAEAERAAAEKLHEKYQL